MADLISQIKPHSHKIVHVPVVAIDEGKIKVTVEGRAQVGMDRVTTSIKIVVRQLVMVPNERYLSFGGNGHLEVLKSKIPTTSRKSNYET